MGFESHPILLGALIERISKLNALLSLSNDKYSQSAKVSNVGQDISYISEVKKNFVS
jgi:hypothetical protein